MSLIRAFSLLSRLRSMRSGIPSPSYFPWEKRGHVGKRGQIYFQPPATWPPPKHAGLRLVACGVGTRREAEQLARRWAFGERLIERSDRLSIRQRKSPEALSSLGASCLGRGDLNPNFYSALICKTRHYWTCRPVLPALCRVDRQ